jgi:hypothetical protein
MKLMDRHFDTIRVLEAELQVVLNTLTEQDFQDAFKMAEAPGTVHIHGKGLLRGRRWPVGSKFLTT